MTSPCTSARFEADFEAVFAPTYRLCAQQWTALRGQGVQTPQIAAWQRLPDMPATYANTNAASVIYNYVLNVYKAPSFQDVRCPQSTSPADSPPTLQPEVPALYCAQSAQVKVVWSGALGNFT